MKVSVDTIWQDKLEITVNKAEMMEIYRAIAKAEHGDRIALDSGLVIKVEYTKEELG